jgi:endogenous inhibitor of DNA gyrase (YacG/DUF329 family)
MSNYVPCPDCGDTIDATQASLDRECPACGTYFGALLKDGENDPQDAEIDYGDAV